MPAKSKSPQHPRRFGPQALATAGTLVLLLAASAHARTIEDEKFHCTITIPSGYLELPVSGDTLYTFATSDPADEIPDAAVSFQRLHGTIGTEHLSLAATGLPDAHFVPGKWGIFDIEVVAAHTKRNGIEFALLIAQIPLAPEAIQVVVLVPLAKEANAPGVLQTFLIGLTGPSTWKEPAPPTEAERGDVLGRGIGRLVFTALLIIVTIAIVARVIRRRR